MYVYVDFFIPYVMLTGALTEAQVHKEFTKDKEQHLTASKEPLHKMTPTAFVFLEIELEEIQ